MSIFNNQYITNQQILIYYNKSTKILKKKILQFFFIYLSTSDQGNFNGEQF